MRGHVRNNIPTVLAFKYEYLNFLKINVYMQYMYMYSGWAKSFGVPKYLEISRKMFYRKLCQMEIIGVKKILLV